MLGILRKLNVSAMAIDQQIDLSVPESSVMLAIYLSVPEAENSSRRLTGIFSRGSTRKYSYNHCRKGCRARVKAEKLNASYSDQLRKLQLLELVADLFCTILADLNGDTQKANFLQERKVLRRQLGKQEMMLPRAR